MNNISHQAAHPSALFQSEQAGNTPRSLSAGDLIVFDGEALRVVSGGSMQLPIGLVEVAHVQRSDADTAHSHTAAIRASAGGLAGVLAGAAAQTADSPHQGAAAEIGLPPGLARKLAEYMGAVQGQPYQLDTTQVELIEGSRKALETFQEADRFMAKLRG